MEFDFWGEFLVCFRVGSVRWGLLFFVYGVLEEGPIEGGFLLFGGDLEGASIGGRASVF